MNLFDLSHVNFEEENFHELLADGKLKIERIVSKDHQSPEGFWYDQDENEWVVLLQGSAEVEFEDESITLKRGDTLLIEKHRKHRVASTTSEPEVIWLAVFW